MASLPTRVARLEASLLPAAPTMESEALAVRVQRLEEKCLGGVCLGGASVLQRIVRLEDATIGSARPGELGAVVPMEVATTNGGGGSPNPYLSQSYRGLYFSHFLSQFGDRMWKFAVPVIFISVWDNDLQPAAVFGFVVYSISLLMLPLVGRGIDETDRLRLVKASTFGQNTCICFSVLLLMILGHRVHRSGAAFASSFFDTMLFVLLIVVGLGGDLCAAAGTIGIEKDWVVVIAAGDAGMLTYLNSTLRRIDLSCKLIAPLFFGLALSIPSTAYGRVIFGSLLVFFWSLLSVLPIYWAWKSVYFQYPSLQTVKPPKKSGNPCHVLFRSNVTYFRHPVFGASLAYCCLYFTVLSDHHPLTTAFLQASGVSPAFLGLARAGGAFTGIIGTFLFPTVSGIFGGHVNASVVAAWCFVLVIAPTAFFWNPGAEGWGSHWMLVAIGISRLFLWMFDLGNVQTMQEGTSEHSRGELNAAQGALCQFMELVMATLSVFYADRFRVLVLSSALGVTSAAVLITLWASRHRGFDTSLTTSISGRTVV